MAVDPDVLIITDDLEARLAVLESTPAVSQPGWIDADDDALAVQTKINGGPSVFMEDVTVDAPIVINNKVSVDFNHHILTSSAGSVLRFEDGAWSGTVQNGRIIATQGHVFDIGQLSNYLIQRVDAETWERDKSVWYQADGGQAYDVLVQSCKWEATNDGLMAPIIQIAGGNPHFNSNTFQRLRLAANGTGTPPQAPVILMRKDEQNWFYQNSFKDINFEQPNAGAIHAYGISGTLFQNLGCFDTLSAGPLTDHLWRVDASTTGLKSINTTFSSVHRIGNQVVDANLHDIYIGGHYPDSLIVDNCGGSIHGNVTHRIKNSLRADIRGGNWREIISQ